MPWGKFRPKLARRNNARMRKSARETEGPGILIKLKLKISDVISDDLHRRAFIQQNVYIEIKRGKRGRQELAGDVLPFFTSSEIHLHALIAGKMEK